MAKRLFVEQQNGGLVRRSGRLSGCRRPNRTLRPEEGAASNSMRTWEREHGLLKLEPEDFGVMSAAGEGGGGPYALGAAAWDLLWSEFDDDFSLDVTVDEKTGQALFASCKRRRR